MTERLLFSIGMKALGASGDLKLVIKTRYKI